MAGIYIHIPFCAQRCVYCDFYLVTTVRSYDRFLVALDKEIEHRALEFAHLESIQTIYLGGGTPSELSLGQLNGVFQKLYREFDCENLKEVTVEVNPDDMNPDYLAGLRELGVNRLSIGIQSFYVEDLTFMGRSHSAEQSEVAIEMARRAGFDQFSIDLIYGLPDQPFEKWGANLEKAVRMRAPHISAYSLTVEDGTVLGNLVKRDKVTPLSDESLADLFLFTRDYLVERGYSQYEISNFALPGNESQHNRSYWEHTNYLGFGPSAHSFWWHNRPSAKVDRWSNISNLRSWADSLLTGKDTVEVDRIRLDAEQLANEYVMLRLRTADGINIDRMEALYGVDLILEKTAEIAWLESEGYIEPIRNDRIRLTKNGLLICDSITRKLIL